MYKYYWVKLKGALFVLHKYILLGKYSAGNILNQQQIFKAKI